MNKKGSGVFPLPSKKSFFSPTKINVLNVSIIVYIGDVVYYCRGCFLIFFGNII